jgi:hypothetical protein
VPQGRPSRRKEAFTLRGTPYFSPTPRHRNVTFLGPRSGSGRIREETLP